MLEKDKLLKIALILSFITIGYNIVEGGVSLFFGLADNTLALLGFGADSFVEVISGLGIAHMVLRMRFSNINSRDKFERFTLKNTGTCFYILTGGLIVGVIIIIIQKNKPETAFPVLIISIISILCMDILMKSELVNRNETNILFN